jgi:hypothetical protein
MLEIARIWAELGYQPQRSVLFAAWDAEEQGLVGSTYYVEQDPIFPLDQTEAYLNLDLIGVGDEVHIFGLDNVLTDQLQTSAITFGISNVFLEEQLYGDARPFAEAEIEIPSSWLAMEVNSSYYPQLHRPDDDPEIIQPDSLYTSGRIALHTLFSLSAGPIGCPTETVTLKLIEGNEAQIPAGVPIQIATGWGATTESYMADFLDAISMEAIIDDGQPIPLSNAYWGPIEENNGSYLSRWIFHMGILEPGEHTIEIVWTLISTVTDGYDLDEDGQLDEYDGEFRRMRLTIEVY